VWPFERSRFVLRVGRDWLDLWSQASTGLAPAGEPIRLEPSNPDILAQAVTLLLKRALVEGRGNVRLVDVVVESACLPVLSLDLGNTLPDQEQVLALLRHRVAQTYGNVLIGDGGWEVIAESWIGAGRGVGYALAPSTRLALLTGAAASHCKVNSVQPAFAWGRARFGRQVPRKGWWLWCEQDRTLVAFIDHGTVCSLSAGAPRLIEQGVSATDLVSLEAARHGHGTESISAVVAGWTCKELGGAARAQTDEPLTFLAAAAPEVNAGRPTTSSAIGA